MAQRKPFAIGKEQEDASYIVAVDETLTLTDLPPEKKGTVDDRRDMHRMGKAQVCITTTTPPHPKEREERKKEKRERVTQLITSSSLFSPLHQTGIPKKLLLYPHFRLRGHSDDDMGFGLVFCELCPSQWGTACYDLDVFGHVGGVWMCHFLYGRNGFDGTDFGWAGESSFFFILSIFHSLFFILFFSCVSCSLFSVPFFLLFFPLLHMNLLIKVERKG